MKEKALYIIGTDTNVGKTFFTALFGALLQEREPHTAVLKPIASGAKKLSNGKLYSEDAKEIMRLTNARPEWEDKMNPVRIEGEFSPKIAAQNAGITIHLEALTRHIESIIHEKDYTIIEGAGGILTPLTEDYTLAEYIQKSRYPVLLVADARLGSINRVGLTAHYCKSMGIPIIGIILNDLDETPSDLVMSNMSEIELYTDIPIFSVLPKYKGERVRDKELSWARKYIPVNRILKAWQEV